MLVKLQIIQASVVLLLPALNTTVISLFWDLSAFCSFSEKNSFLGLQQAMLGIETRHELGFIDLVLCHGGVWICNQKSPPTSCPLVSCLTFANCCLYALLTVFSHQVTWKLCFSFWHDLRGSLLIEAVTDAVRWGYFLLRALARILVSGHSSTESGGVRLDNLFHFELPFHHF